MPVKGWRRDIERVGDALEGKVAESDSRDSIQNLFKRYLTMPPYASPRV
jgi:hypothetical protein